MADFEDLADVLETLTDFKGGAHEWKRALDEVERFDLGGRNEPPGCVLGELLKNDWTFGRNVLGVVFDEAGQIASDELKERFGIEQQFNRVLTEGGHGALFFDYDDEKNGLRDELIETHDPDGLRTLSKTTKTVLADWGGINADELADFLESDLELDQNKSHGRGMH